MTNKDTMSCPDIEQPPLKKRRFFTEESPPPEKGPNALDAPSPSHPAEALVDGTENFSAQSGVDTNEDAISRSKFSSIQLDQKTLESFVGTEVSNDNLQRLQDLCGGSMERAINMFLDGSWTNAAPVSSSANDVLKSQMITQDSQDRQPDGSIHPESTAAPYQHQKMQDHRYVGAFGVGAWATRSGTGLVKHGESVKIERTRIKPPVKIGRGGKVIQPAKGSVARMRTDIIVRFTNVKGEEVGRLPKDTALWVSTLMDQKVCYFEGTCVFIPERVRINDTIYLQLRCSLLKTAFDSGGFIKPEDNNRTTGIFEEKETSQEKDLRLRQVALVKLFDEVNLHPSTVNQTTAKHKREGILQAAEVAERYEKDDDPKTAKNSPDGGSSPSGEDEAEDGKELEQDQLDSLYKKAQSFDFDMPAQEPAETFSMNLRKYQKQALHWMISKEKDEKSDKKELSMHPLWEEYHWPTKDMDDQDVPGVVNQSSFYVNPYSGELSLKFPVQDQHCLGGILADGERHFMV